MSEKITVEKFDQAMKQAVEQRGVDYVYPTRDDLRAETGDDSLIDQWYVDGECRYIKPDGAPACIIGQAIYNIDPTILTPDTEARGSADLLEELKEEGLLSQETYDAIEPAASRAQFKQDEGGDWGTALHEYRRTRKGGA